MELNLKFTEEEAKKIVGEGPLADLIKMCSYGGPDEAETPTPVTGTPEPQTPAPVTPKPQTPAPVTPKPQTPAPAEVPTAAPAYTRDQLALAAGDVMNTHMEELQALLKSLGVVSLIELHEDKYDAFAAGIRKLGAKI